MRPSREEKESFVRLWESSEIVLYHEPFSYKERVEKRRYCSPLEATQRNSLDDTRGYRHDVPLWLYVRVCAGLRTGKQACTFR